jgi:hypothetical protein
LFYPHAVTWNSDGPRFFFVCGAFLSNFRAASLDKLGVNLDKSTESQSPLFQSALDLYRELFPLADTKKPIFGERLLEHGLRLLEHVSTASAASSRRERARSLRFARMRQAKVIAVVEAAAFARQISSAQRLKLLRSMASLDHEIVRSLHPGDELPMPAPEGDPGRAASASPPVDRVLTDDEAAELKRETTPPSGSTDSSGPGDSNDSHESNGSTDSSGSEDPSDSAPPPRLSG